jgi:hypothetical protein
VLNRGPVLVVRDACGGNVGIEVFFEIVVTEDIVLLAAFLVQAHPNHAAPE